MGRKEAKPGFKGRGAHVNPPNRFLPTRVEPDLEHLEHDEEARAELGRAQTQYLPDRSQSIVAENDSPDVPFRYSINPYRQITALFQVFARKHGLDGDLPPHRRDRFRPPRLPGGQMRLFE